MASYRRILSACYKSNSCFSPAPDFATAASPAPIPIGPPPFLPTSPNKANQHLTVLVLIIASVIATCFILLTYYAVLLRQRSALRRRRRQRRSPATPAAFASDLIDDDAHHVWYIRTVGLDEPTIKSIAVCEYKTGEGIVDGTDCSVCLGEFNDGDLVRLLPKCGHAFHIPCIDTWLRAHVNCPLCRAPVAAASAVASVYSSPTDPRGESDSSSSAGSGALADLNANSSSSIGESSLWQPQVEEGRGSSSTGVLEVPSYSSSVLESEFRVLIGLGGRCVRQSDGSDQRHGLDEEVNCNLPPVRRSASLGSLAIGALSVRGESESCSWKEGKDTNFGAGPPSTLCEKEENGLEEDSQQKDAIAMERSLSSSSGMFFLSRFGRGRGKSILQF